MTETRRSTRRSTVQKKAAASDADVQQGQGELITTIPKIDFNDEIVENHPDSSEAATQTVQNFVMDSLRSEIVNIVMDSFS